MNEPLENAYKSPENLSSRGPAGSRSPTLGAWLALLIFVPIAFLITLVATCTGSFLTIASIHWFPPGDNRVFANQIIFAFSLGLGAIAGITIGILITRFILRLSRNRAAKRESNQ